jgi:hypothetical protein
MNKISAIDLEKIEITPDKKINDAWEKIETPEINEILVLGRNGKPGSA